jgi:TetR/AcrR family transcriptional regulator, transcriptional repressor of bet genes
VGRRSVAAERRQQIIAATVSCMAAHGVSGTTLERIADTAGMARGHVRHFVGNRDELLTDAARVFYFGDAALEETDLDVLATRAPLVPPSSDVPGALDYLFGEFAAPGTENAATLAFVDAGRTIPAIRDIVVRAYRGIEESLVDVLRRVSPARDERAYSRTAWAVLTIAMGNNFLNDLEPSDERIRDAREAAEQLIADFAS